MTKAVQTKDNKKDKRKVKRWILKNALRVYDRDCESFVGWMLNITLQGMQLETENPLEMDAEYIFCVEIVTEDVMIHVRSMWTSYDDEIEIHRTGFRFLDLSKNAELKIKSLIDALKFTP